VFHGAMGSLDCIWQAPSVALGSLPPHPPNSQQNASEKKEDQFNALFIERVLDVAEGMLT